MFYHVAAIRPFFHVRFSPFHAKKSVLTFTRKNLTSHTTHTQMPGAAQEGNACTLLPSMQFATLHSVLSDGKQIFLTTSGKLVCHHGECSGTICHWLPLKVWLTSQLPLPPDLCALVLKAYKAALKAQLVAYLSEVASVVPGLMHATITAL